MKTLHMGTVVVLMLTILLVGCQEEIQPEQTGQPSQSSTSAGEQATSPEDASELLTDPDIATDGSMDAYLNNFAAQLAESGLALEGKAAKDASSIGAAEGYGFQVNHFPLEVYLFDSSSDDEKTTENLKTAKESGYITMFGLEINGETPKPDCTLHENLVLIFPGEEYGMSHPDKESIVKAFVKSST